SRIHCGCIQIWQKDICKVLGQIHFYGRRLSGQRARAERIKDLQGGRGTADQDERKCRRVPQNHNESPCHAACKHDHHGLGCIRRSGRGIALSIVGLKNEWLAPASALFLILVAVEFFLPLRALGSAFHVAMNGASAGRKIISLLNLPDPVWGKEEVTGTQLQLDGVTFSYDGKRDVLKDVSMTFPEKGMTAIVGESGCGKSTVVNMLIGAYRPKAGIVAVGGKPLESVTRE